MRKVIGLFFISFITLFLISCNRNIPDGDIKDFVSNFSFENAFDSHKVGTSIICSTIYIDGVEDGRFESISKYDVDEKYSMHIKNVSGSFYGNKADQYDFYNYKEILFISDGVISANYNKDDCKSSLDYTEDDIVKSINNVFYLEIEAGFHSGGIYYGDYILANIHKFYNQFSLNDEKTHLIYSVNTSSIDKNGGEIVTMVSYTVDSYGMIKELSTITMDLNNKIKIHTTISCNYNDFIKEYEL